MKEYLKKNLCFIILLAVFGLVGGYFTSLYSLESLAPEMIEEAVAQLGSTDMLILVSTLQSLSYALVLGLVGKALAEKIGLWRSPRLEAGPVSSAVVVSLIVGVAIILPDLLFFNNFSDILRESYLTKPTLNYIIASLTYGGVIEEVMLRLFFMSLIAFIIMKLSKRSEPTDAQIIVANFIAAVLFAAGHLPATITTLGISGMLIFRCFLLNGTAGLFFGRLYRKYGLLYSCLAHAGAHIVSKIIWLLFI